jgi:PhzF family phenazine biosynthesis protein
MKEFQFKKIDAFATKHSSGNPAGMVYLNKNDEISGKEMLQIAKELKGFVNEVGFVKQLDEESFSLRYYSSEREVEFCGHATVAIFNELFLSREDLKEKKQLRLRINSGDLIVWNRLAIEKAIFISAPLPKFRTVNVERTHLARALGCDTASFALKPPVAVVNAGLETLLAPIESLQGLMQINPDFDALKTYCNEHNLDILTLYCTETADRNNQYRTRVFAPTFGYLEDPATGSGNAALGYYLLEHGLWEGEAISLEQNGNRNQPNIIRIKAETAEEGPRQILFGGGAITRFQGTYLLA